MEPTKPYWLNDAPYQDFRSTAELPARADVVVIGGGITGVSTAYFLRQHGIEVTLLERRGLSGGATGRNGGHISPGTSERFSESVRRYGVERTRAIYDYSTRCAMAVQDFVRENDVQCELRFNGSGIAAVVGTGEATARIPDGARISVDGTNGTVAILAGASS